ESGTACQTGANAVALVRVQTETLALRTSSTSKYPIRENAMPALSGEDGARQGWDDQNADDERADYHERLHAVDQVLVLVDSLRKRRQVLEHKALENHQKSVRNNGDERVLHESLEPRPEQPVELRHDEERNEDRSEQATHRAGDQPEGYDCERDHFRKSHDDQEQPVQQICQDGPGVWLNEVIPEFVEMLKCHLEGTGVENVRKIVGLIGDQIAERHSDAR